MSRSAVWRQRERNLNWRVHISTCPDTGRQSDQVVGYAPLEFEPPNLLKRNVLMLQLSYNTRTKKTNVALVYSVSLGIEDRTTNANRRVPFIPLVVQSIGSV